MALVCELGVCCLQGYVFQFLPGKGVVFSPKSLGGGVF